MTFDIKKKTAMDRLSIRFALSRCSVMSALLALVWCLASGESVASPEIPGAPQARPIVLVGGTIHPVAGAPIEDGMLLFEEGKITAIGKKVKIPKGARRIDVQGKHVYPGLINAWGTLGLSEVNSVRGSIDRSETGSFNPNVRAKVAVNPDSELIPVTRANGVLLSLTMPSGGLVSGTSAVIQHDGWTWEDMTLRSPVGMHVNWPRMEAVIDWHSDKSKHEQIRDRDAALKRIHQVFDDALAYKKARAANGSNSSKQGLDAKWEAMLPVLDGELPLIVQADRAEQIQAAVAFATERGLRLILAGGYDAEQCAPLLKKQNVPVIVAGVLRAPERRGDAYDTPYTLPERLRKAGVRYCIGMGGRFSASNMRNLPYHASMAAAHGLSRDEALAAVTIRAAEILGVGDRVGSLEVGKDATLVIADGDLLDTPTHVEEAFIQGRKVDLNNRHKRLWKKYQEKSRRKKLEK